MKLLELDKLAGEKLMGWVLVRDDWYAASDLEYMTPVAYWNPTDNIAQAWECLSKTEGSYGVIYNSLFKTWFCSLWQNSHIAEAKTAPEAIVIACLRAKGVLSYE